MFSPTKGAVLLLTMVAGLGCHTAGEICEDTRAAYNDAYARCGIPITFQEKWLTFPSGPCAGIPVSCGRVNEVRDIEEIVDVCWVALEQVSCEELAADPTLSSACDTRNFVVHIPPGSSCL